MRTVSEIQERIQLAIVEEIQSSKLLTAKEPENAIPSFVVKLSNLLTEITLDEIEIRRRY